MSEKKEKVVFGTYWSEAEPPEGSHFEAVLRVCRDCKAYSYDMDETVCAKCGKKAETLFLAFWNQ